MIAVERMMNMKLSEKLKNLRKEANYSQEYIGEVCHVSRQAVSRWEAEDAYPDLANLILLSNLYHVSIDYLVKEEMLSDYYHDAIVERTTSTNYSYWRNQWCSILLKGYNGWEFPIVKCMILDEDDTYIYLQVKKKRNHFTFGILKKEYIDSLTLLSDRKARKMPASQPLPIEIKNDPLGYFVGKKCDILNNLVKFIDLFSDKSFLGTNILRYEQGKLYGMYQKQAIVFDGNDIVHITES